MKILKKVGAIVLDVVIVIVLLLSVLMIIANATSKKGEPPNLFGYVLSSVQTDSMEPTIKVGDMIVGKKPKEGDEIEVGDIISFYDTVDGQRIIKTHRVVEVEKVGNDYFYTTRGDNAPDEDFGTRLGTEVVAIYKFRLPALGAIVDFLRKPVGFVVCLVLPMVALIGWQVYKLIAIYLQQKKAAEGEISQEEKDAIIREYLSKQNASDESGAQPSDESGGATKEQPSAQDADKNDSE